MVSRQFSPQAPALSMPIATRLRSSKQDVNDDRMTQLKRRPDEFARPSDQIKRTRAALDNNRTPFCLGFDLTNPNRYCDCIWGRP
jgi:hypothetical protein